MIALAALLSGSTTPPPSVAQLYSSPFVQDTLLALISQPNRAAPVLGFNPNAQRDDRSLPYGTGAYYRPTAQDSVNFVRSTGSPEGDRFILSHEIGHAFQARRISPQVSRSVEQRFGEMRRTAPNAYGATSKKEHFAEAFARAITLLQSITDPQAFDRALQVTDRILPGTREITDFLRSHPLYSRHPLSTRT